MSKFVKMGDSMVDIDNISYFEIVRKVCLRIYFKSGGARHFLFDCERSIDVANKRLTDLLCVKIEPAFEHCVVTHDNTYTSAASGY